MTAVSLIHMLKNIKEIESSLISDLNKTNAEANKKIEQAREKARKIIDDMMQKIEIERKEIQKNSEIEIRNKLIEIDITTQKILNEIEEKAKSNKDAAINFILKYIFGEINA
jgi:vacuolar-type H+-ATPase subunit H